MEIKPAEVMVATVSLGLAATSYSVTLLATYSGPGVEFVLPLLGCSWVVAQLRSRQVAAKVEADDADDSEAAA